MKKTFKEFLSPPGVYTEGPMSIVLHQGILYKLDVLFAYAKDLPVTVLDVTDLKWQVNQTEDEARMKKADLNVPILVHPQNGKYIILDGNTRLMKAIKTGAKTLPAKIIFEDILAYARMGSGPDVAWASNVQDQNAYIDGGAKTIKPIKEAAQKLELGKYKVPTNATPEWLRGTLTKQKQTMKLLKGYLRNAKTEETKVQRQQDIDNLQKYMDEIQKRLK